MRATTIRGRFLGATRALQRRSSGSAAPNKVSLGLVDVNFESLIWRLTQTTESTYVCYGDLADNTATAFEFGGGNGYTGCVNCGGELLQITAPSKRHGIIFARGRFEYSLYSSLARGQRWPGGKSTFGVQFPFHKTTQRSGRMTWPRIAVCKELIQQGSFNHRWPVQKYPLCLETFDASSGESGTPNVKHGIGTCSVVSYVDDDRFVYQVLRFDLDNPDEIPDGTKIVLRIGGSINFRSFLEKDKPPTMAAGKMTAGDRVPARRLASQVTGPGIETATSSQQKAREPPTSDTAVYTWAADPSVRLAARLYLVEWADPAKDRGPAMPLELVCQPGKRSVLKDDTKNPPGYSYRASINVTKAHGKDKAQGSFTVAAVFALFETSSGISWPTTLKSPSSMSSSMGTVADEKRETTTNRAPGDGLLISDQEVYDYLGVNSRSERATGAMWETAFLEKGEDSYAISELSEVSLVGRCLEKTLMVDLIPASTQDPQNPNAPQPMALMSNLFVQANLDLKAVL